MIAFTTHLLKHGLEEKSCCFKQPIGSSWISYLGYDFIVLAYSKLRPISISPAGSNSMHAAARVKRISELKKNISSSNI